jgi:uncharacterized protein (TIGR02391 family)
MEDFRPMPIMLIKKRFLKVLYENFMNRENTDCFYILRFCIAKYFKINLLTNQEYEAGKIGIVELQRDGYIRPSHEPRKFILTDKGLKVAIQKIEDMKLPIVDLSLLLSSRYDLMKKVFNDYLEGDYESAIFKAFKLLEEKARLKSNLPQKTIGVYLMDEAFNKKSGLLRHPNFIEEAEREGLHFLMRGAISCFKNPSSHKNVSWDDPNKVIQILCFAHYLLDIVDQCKLVN